MEINPEIKSILKGCKIDVDQGILALLSIYHNLNTDRIIPEELLRKISHTRIVSKDHTSNTITWNIPLFTNMVGGNFDWVADWMKPFGEIGGAGRRGSFATALKRMKDLFAKNPEIRKEDVYAARDLYFRTEKPVGQYVKTSHNFIKEGMGAMANSPLLMWYEKVKESKAKPTKATGLVGKIM